MRKIIYSLMAVLCCAVSSAQIPLATWRSLGPTPFPTNGSGQINGIGRITKLKFDPIIPNKLYATSASGGLYISTDGGTTWTGTGTDQMPSHKEATICIDYANTQVLYLGTGDPNYYYAGLGVWKSIDGGATWAQSNTGMGSRLVDELLMDPNNNNTLIAATNSGIYKSYNAGANWTRKLNYGRFTDMDFKPGSNGRVIYACTHDTLLRSDDVGETWTKVTAGYYIPGGAGGQGLRIGVTEADTNVVYLGLVANRGSLFKSTDGGHSLSIVKDSFDLSLTGYNANDGGQGNYNFDITVDPLDANTVYWVSHNNWKSTLGGIPSSWVMLTHWPVIVHTDMHNITFDPMDHTKLYNANDGGIWLTTNGGTTWAQKSDGLSATEISPAASSRLDKNTISIGTQDNGELYYNSNWITNRGGDWYKYMAYDYTNPRTVYYANGKRRIVSAGDQSMHMPIVNDFERIAFSRLNHEVAFAGGDTVLRTHNLNSSIPLWDILTVFPAGIKAMALSPTDSNRLYIITSDNHLHISEDAMSVSPTFTTYSTPSSTGNTAGIVELPLQPNVVYMYNGGNLYTSPDTGHTWSSVTYNYPTSLNVLGIVHDPFTTDQSIFIANTGGVYYKCDTMTRWQKYSQGLPTVANIQGLDAFNDGTANSVLRVPFYGRGMWEASINTVKNIVAVNFGADAQSVCAGTAVHFTDSTTSNPNSWSWTFAGGNPSSSTAQNPIVVYNTPGTYAVTLYATNTASHDTKTIQSYISVYSTDTVPVTEGFEDTLFPPRGWTNYDGGNDSVLWQRSNFGGFGTSGHSAYFDNYYHDESGKTKSLYFGADLSQADSARLSFDVAYQTLKEYSDSLEITLSDDCGATFHRIYIKGGNTLATAPHLDSPSAPFSPSAAQWRKDSISLHAYAHRPGVIISFNNISNYGTDLYLDNINLRGWKETIIGIAQVDERGKSISIFPNPSNGTLHVIWHNAYMDKTRLSLYDALGNKVKDITLATPAESGETTLDISDLSNGVYSISSDMDKGIMTKVSLVK